MEVYGRGEGEMEGGRGRGGWDAGLDWVSCLGVSLGFEARVITMKNLRF